MTIYAPAEGQHYSEANCIDEAHIEWVMASVDLHLCWFMQVKRCVACVCCRQVEWLVHSVITSKQQVVLLATSGGNPPCCRLAKLLVDKGVTVRGIVAMSGTPDPNQVLCFCYVCIAILRSTSCFLPFCWQEPVTCPVVTTTGTEECYWGGHPAAFWGAWKVIEDIKFE